MRAFRLGAAALAAMAAGAVCYAVTERLSLIHAAYCSLGTATSVGCDITPHGAGRIVTVFLMLTALPLLAAIFSWATSERVHQRGTRRHDELRDLASAIHQITADTHQAVTTSEHPLAPDRED